MAINPHFIIEEINGIRCSIVEKKISPERCAFLTSILESNGMVVVSMANEDGTVTIGVTDIIFNPLYALYSRSLRSPNGKLVTPAYWYQKQQTDLFYWDYK